MLRKVLLVFSMVLFVSILGLAECTSILINDFPKVGILEKDAVLTSYTPHESIHIDNNADFESQGWPGSGTKEDPYIIERLNISLEEPDIYIYGTTVYFEIRDCIISCTVGDWIPPIPHGGIQIINVIHATVKNCIVESTLFGLHLFQSHDCTLINNTFTNNYSDDFYLYESNNCTIINNTLHGKGLDISGTNSSNWLHDISGNTVNGKPLGYFADVTDFVVDGSEFGQVILANCSSLTVKDGIFENVSVGVDFGFCNNCMLTNNTVINSKDGLHIQCSNNCVVTSNFVSNASFNGFEFSDSYNLTMKYNTATNNEHRGFDLSNLHNCTLTNNTATNSRVGFLLDKSNNSMMTYNTAKFNSYTGIELTYSHKCMVTNNTATHTFARPHYNPCNNFFLIFSDYCTLVNNTALNSEDGFALWGSNNCTLTNNTIISNSRYGIFLDSRSEKNLLYFNRLGYNGDSNAWDDGVSNRWDNGTHGNYWLDYNGIGTYTIPGDGSSIDNHPLIWESATPASPTENTFTPIDISRILGTIMTFVPVGVLFIILGSCFVRSRRKMEKVSIFPIQHAEGSTETPESTRFVTTSRTPPPISKPIEKTVKVFRGGEVIGGRFEYKVKVQNDTPYVIHRVTVTIVTYPQACLELVGSTVRQLPMIEPGGFRSPEFVFTPTEDCVQGEIIPTVSYLDYQGDLQVVKVEPYVIRSVCDLLNPYEVSLQEFERIISNMETTSEARSLTWNPKVLYSKAESLLPAKNFFILDSKSETRGGEFKGVIRGIAEGKYTRKRVAVQLIISGPVDGREAKVEFEGIGDDIAMLPTTIEEIADDIDSWTCMNCGAALTADSVEDLKRRQSVECRYCQHIMTIDLYI